MISNFSELRFDVCKKRKIENRKFTAFFFILTSLYPFQNHKNSITKNPRAKTNLSKRNSISFPENSLSRKNSLKNSKIRNRTAYISIRKSKDLNKYYLGDPKFQREILKVEKDYREDSCSESTTSLIDMKSISSDHSLNSFEKS